MTKLIRSALVVGGVVLILGGVVLMAVIVPGMRVFPDDVDTTRYYDVDYLTLLNPAAMEFIRIPPEASGDLRLERNVFVEETDGSQTLVRETQMMFSGESPLIPPVVKMHTVDRSSLAALDDPPEAWTELDGFVDREGLALGWGPEGLEKQDYVGWAEDFRGTVDLVYVEEQMRGGINTYYFTAAMPPTRMSDEHLAVMGFPTELSIEALTQLAAGMEIEDPAMRTQVTMFLPLLVSAAVRETQELEPGAEIAVPLEYYYDYTGEYWVEPETGVLIDTHKYEHRAVGFPLAVVEHLADALTTMNMDPEALTQLLPVTVNEFEYRATEESVADARADAEDARDTLELFGTTVPMGMIAVGIIALVAGFYMAFMVSGKQWKED